MKPSLNTVLVLAALSAVLSCNPADLRPSPARPSPSALSDAGASTRAGGAAIARTSSVVIQVEPSDSGAAILSEIEAATKSVHVTMYLLTNRDVQNALISLHDAGKDVRVILNHHFPPNGGDNLPAFNKLKNAGVDVVWAPSDYTFTHEKAIVIDGAKVLIMTMNLTATSAFSNREYVATDTDADDVADAEAIFEADFAGRTISCDGKLVVSPTETQPVGARDRLKQLIDGATTSLDVEVQSLSETGLTDAIIAAHEANVAVRVVTTAAGAREETPAQADALAKLKQAGVPLVGLGDPYVHAKAIVVDDKLVFVGSQNFTATALFYNRELGVVTDAPSEVMKVRDVIASDFQRGTPR
ncbi:MAG: phospholipase D-like domain-containing protein [Polyangiaceae bacterium]|nr:phospholipase D-like domain-containing protein [Polyangiaceae bacterium]